MCIRDSLYCLWFSLINFLAIYLLVVEKGKWVFAFIGGGLTLNLILNYLLIPHMELWGAVLATTISMFLTLIGIIVGNHFCGLRVQKGILFVVAVPMCVLLGPIWSGVAMLGVIAVAVLTTAFFSAEEKAMAIKHARKFTDKFVSRKSSS